MTSTENQLTDRHLEVLRTWLEQPERIAPRLHRLPRTGRVQDFELSFAQRRLWFVTELDPATVGYNVPVAWELTGTVDANLLLRAFDILVDRHEALRTYFPVVDGEPVQRVLPEFAIPFAVQDLRDLPPAERTMAVDKALAEESLVRFPLAQRPPIRVRLHRLADDRHVLMVNMHHIITDGWSLAVLASEMAEVCTALNENREPQLAPTLYQYADYARWQVEALSGPELEEKLRFWQHYLAGAGTVLAMPTDRSRPEVPSGAGGAHRFDLDPGLVAELRAMAREAGATLFPVLLTAFQVLLGRHATQDDIVVGVPAANRTLPEVENVLGFFVNMLPLRAHLSDDPTFADLLRRTAQASAEALSHQDVPFELLVERMQPERALNLTPMFQAMFALQNTPSGAWSLPGVTVRPYPVPLRTAKFDLALELTEYEGGIQAALVYSLDLFDPETADELCERYTALLQDAVRRPATRVSRLALGPSGASPGTASATESGPGPDRSPSRQPAGVPPLHRLFERQAELRPDAPAVSYGDDTLTYGQLEARANALAECLRAAGVGPDVPVAVFLDRSFDLIAAYLAVLKAGGAYLPLEIDAPVTRIEHMLRDAGAPICVTDPAGMAHLADLPVRLLCVADVPPASKSRPEVPLADDNLISVYFTSGSTGRPKAVGNTHGGWARRMAAMQAEYRLAPGEVVLQKTTVTFDVSAVEIFWPLTVGGTVALVGPDQHRDPAAILAATALHNVAVLHFVPSMLALFLERYAEAGRPKLPALRAVISGGEALSGELVRNFQELLGASCRLVNKWGVTEASIDSTLHRCIEANGRDGVVPIGRAFGGHEVYVLDGDLTEVVPNVPGELFIGGVGVARGYLGQPALTAERFVPDPFSGVPGARLYRTGDLARRRRDGTVDFLGRADGQVKIRGVRIEVGEIESVLLAHPEIHSAVVVAREDRSGSKILVAYLVSEEDVDLMRLRAYLRERLLSYMMPSAFVVMAALPLTTSGKVDRKMLPPPAPSDIAHDEHEPPRTPAERAMAVLWASVLQVPRIGADDDFFDLGGHSLQAVRLLRQVQRQYGVRLPLRTLFEARTLAAFTERVAATASTPAVDGDPPGLVGLAEGGAGIPLCLSHPVGGTVFCYTGLARHLSDHPVVAVEAGTMLTTRLEDLAAGHTHTLLEHFGRGRTVTGGWSMGGVVALEVAHQLTAAGVDVEALLAIDALPATAPDVGAAVRRSAAEVDALLARWRATPDGAVRLTAADESLLRSFGVDPASVAADDIEALTPAVERWSRHLSALAGYVPRPAPCRVVLIVAADNPPPVRRQVIGAWRELAPAGLEVHEVPGTHITILEEPSVGMVAAKLRQAFSQ